jgi:hypothetical protein
VVITNTNFYVAPGGNPDALVTVLPKGATVTLNGQAVGLWVFITTVGEVVTGWVDARNLRTEIAVTPSPRPALSPGTDPSPGVTSSGDTPTPTVTPEASFSAQISTERLPAPHDPPGVETQNRKVKVTVLQVRRTLSLIPGEPTPVPDPNRVKGGLPIENIRVQLVNVFGDILSEAVTLEDGMVTLSQAVPPDTALFVQLPAVGIRAAVVGPPDRPADITIALPGGLE